MDINKHSRAKRYLFCLLLILTLVFSLTIPQGVFADAPTTSDPGIATDPGITTEPGLSTDTGTTTSDSGISTSASITSPAAAIGIMPLAATVAGYINLEQYAGSYTIPGASGATGTSDYPDVATFDSGVIYAHNNGIATITLDNGDVYCVSVYWAYPQPKTGAVRQGVSPAYLRKWAQAGTTDFTAPRHLAEAR